MKIFGSLNAAINPTPSFTDSFVFCSPFETVLSLILGLKYSRALMFDGFIPAGYVGTNAACIDCNQKCH